MSRKHYIFIGILILALSAGIFSYSKPVNQQIDSLNDKFLWSLPHFPERPFVLGLDLQGGVSLIYEADLSSIFEGKEEAMEGLRDVIERRVNAFGVTEAVVQVQGENRLAVELPGVTNVQEAIETIGQTPFLEFQEERPLEDAQVIINKIEEVQAAQEAGEDISQIENLEIAFQNPYFQQTELTGKYLDKATVVFDQTSFQPQIQLQFNSEGSKIFEEITARNVNKRIAIYLDGLSIIDTSGDGVIDLQDIYAPVVQDRIIGGTAIISGNLDAKEANTIAQRLNSGALPVPIGNPISQQTVGPTLGASSLQKSLLAAIYGLISVGIFMIVVYRLPGLIAVIALLIYTAITLSVFKLVPVTLSLAGIGGFILSIGMAVDANILIFARMKEELKTGRGIQESVREGFQRAWPSIRDSNFNSLIVCAILFIFATSFVKGFALTLAIGILVSMFSAIFITKVLLDIFLGRWAEKIKWLI